MGGLTGCLALADGAGPDTEWVGRAALRVAHRGPDDEGFFADPDLALGFKRLAVIDPLSPVVRSLSTTRRPRGVSNIATAIRSPEFMNRSRA